jgi:hypothetical protein
MEKIPSYVAEQDTPRVSFAACRRPARAAGFFNAGRLISVGTTLTILAGLSAALVGCSDNSKPGLAQVKELVAERFGQCPQWSISDVQRIDGAPNPGGYEVSYSFVLAFKDGPDAPDEVSGDIRCDFGQGPDGTLRVPPDVELYMFTQWQHGQTQNLAPFHTRFLGAGDTEFVKSELGWHGRDRVTGKDVTFTPIDASLVDPASASSPGQSTAATSPAPDADTSQTSSASNQDDGAGFRQRIARWIASMLGVSHNVSPDNTAPAPAPASTTVAAGPTDALPSLASAPVASPAMTAEVAALEPSAPLQATASPAADAGSVSVASAPIAVSQPQVADQTVKPDPDKGALEAQVRAAKLQLLVANGQDQLDTGRYESAIATAQAVLLLDPDNVAAQQLRDAARSSLQKRAQAAPAKPQPHAVATRAPEPVAPAVVAVRTAADFDGNWRGTFSCGDYVGLGTVPHPTGFTQRASMTIRQGHVTLLRSGGGANAFEEELQGDIQPDLSLRLNGEGHYTDTSQKPWTALYTGRFSADANQPAALKLNGEILTWRGDLSRPCEVTLSR